MLSLIDPSYNPRKNALEENDCLVLSVFNFRCFGGTAYGDMPIICDNETSV